MTYPNQRYLGLIFIFYSRAFVHMCICVPVCLSCVDGCPQRTDKLIRSPRAVVTHCFDSVDVGPGVKIRSHGRTAISSDSGFKQN